MHHLLRIVVTSTILAIVSGSAFASQCASLAGRTFGFARIIGTDDIQPPFATSSVAPTRSGMVQVGVPFCRVRGLIRPVPDSEIAFEVWLPEQDRWNGRYQGVGNGGFAGSISYDSMRWALEGGFAASGTDTGHVGTMSEALWGMGHPEKIKDLGWRAVHETALASKAIVQAYYGKAAAHSYFAGCSTGGRQALLEAQRFPDDYDGIVVGAPANYWPQLLASDAVIVKTVMDDPDRWVSPEKLALVNKASLSACKALGGLLEDPARCDFHFERLACSRTKPDSCLTPKEISTLNLIYKDLHDEDGRFIYPGFVVGDEIAIGNGKLGPAQNKGTGSATYPFPKGFYGSFLHQDPSWDVDAFNLKADLNDVMGGPIGEAVAAENPDLSAFKRKGGKLIHYHGWHDPSISARSSIRYYESVVERQGGIENAQTFYRLFLGTGMEHCAGGPGPNAVGGAGVKPPSRDPSHDVVAAVEHWVEDGVPPSQIYATRYSGNDPEKGIESQRPWCPYPEVAHYSGHGDITKPENFACKVASQK
jgi:feruloyl esterase